MNREEYLQLIQRVSEGTATASELAQYNRYFNAYQQPGTWDDQEMGSREVIKSKLDQLVLDKIFAKPVVSLRTRLLRFTAAAAVIALMGTVAYFYFRLPQDQQKQVVKTKIVPGGNKAYLTLANGKRITLTDAANGELAQEAGITISKNTDGLVVYTLKTQNEADPDLVNTIETPNGGKYQVLLPDGTKVWLNSASRLIYPLAFSAGKARKVTLIGEAYFEVAKNPAMPFKVTTALQEVSVLGTHFNIMAYADAESIKTTLLEGAVRVSSTAASTLLTPGQQAILRRDNLLLSTTNVVTAQTIAWKNGYFFFNDDTIEDIMKQVCRWYDLEVEFKGNVRHKRFDGMYSMNKDINELMKGLELTGLIHYKIEGRRIIVMA